MEKAITKVGSILISKKAKQELSTITDELSKTILKIASWSMLFADDIVLIGESSEEASTKLEDRREILESKRLSISRTKTEY